MARIDVPITGSVLRWAIGESGYTVETLAEAINVETEAVNSWIDETERPSKGDFDALAIKLKRPTAIFFLPEAPETTPIQTELRSLPGTARSRLLPSEARWLRRAHSLQDLAAWVSDELDVQMPELPSAETSEAPETAARRARERLGVPVDEQLRWSTATQALSEWRAAVETLGVLTFELPLGAEGARGMSLWDERVPAVVLNKRGNNPQSRSFTLFHEFGHLLLGGTSMCIGYVSVRVRASGHRATERWCDRFAAAVLMPVEEFSSTAADLLAETGRGTFTELKDVRGLAEAFNVSMRAAVLRLIDLNLAQESLYGQVNKLGQRVSAKGGRSPARPELRVQQYGRRLVTTLLDASSRDLIGRHELMRTLDVSSDELTSIGEALPAGS